LARRKRLSAGRDRYGQPNSVTANYVTDGKADYTVNIVNGSPNSGPFGVTDPNPAVNPVVNAARIAGMGWEHAGKEDQVVGETTLHELTHRITGLLDLPYNGGPNGVPNILQFNSYLDQFKLQASARLTDPVGYLLSPDELKALYKKCLEKQHARGGGGGGGAALPTNTGTETLWSCSTHYYWSGELGPGASTTCSATWSFGYGFRGFIF